jgi:protein CpxP
MKKRILLPALIVGTVFTATLVMAGPGGYGRGNCNGNGGGPGTMTFEQHEERVENKLERMGAILELTEAQKVEIAALFNDQWQDHQQLREQMHASRDEMRDVHSPGDFNETDFRAKAAKRSELKTEMMVQKAKLRQQVYNLLTPEQQEKADAIGGMMGGGKSGRHHGGYGY